MQHLNATSKEEAHMRCVMAYSFLARKVPFLYKSKRFLRWQTSRTHVFKVINFCKKSCIVVVQTLTQPTKKPWCKRYISLLGPSKIYFGKKFYIFECLVQHKILDNVKMLLVGLGR